MNVEPAPNPVVAVGAARFGNALPLALIAGPCALESRDHAFEMAAALKDIAGKIEIGLVYKTSFDKANRTSAKSNRGIGLDGALPIFAEIRRKFGVPRQPFRWRGRVPDEAAVRSALTDRDWLEGTPSGGKHPSCAPAARWRRPASRWRRPGRARSWHRPRPCVPSVPGGPPRRARSGQGSAGRRPRATARRCRSPRRSRR